MVKKFRLLYFMLCIGFFVLAAQVLNTAFAACSQPSEDTKFCVETDIWACDHWNIDQIACDQKPAIWRNLFPDGKEDAEEGRTTQQQDNCSYTSICVWDTATQKCYIQYPVTPPATPNWSPADRTVDDPTRTCITVADGGG